MVAIVRFVLVLVKEGGCCKLKKRNNINKVVNDNLRVDCDKPGIFFKQVMYAAFIKSSKQVEQQCIPT